MEALVDNCEGRITCKTEHLHVTVKKAPQISNLLMRHGGVHVAARVNLSKDHIGFRKSGSAPKLQNFMGSRKNSVKVDEDNIELLKRRNKYTSI